MKYSTRGPVMHMFRYTMFMQPFKIK